MMEVWLSVETLEKKWSCQIIRLFHAIIRCQNRILKNGWISGTSQVCSTYVLLMGCEKKT
jgi:hypothetical protein